MVDLTHSEGGSKVTCRWPGGGPHAVRVVVRSHVGGLVVQ